MSPFLRGYYLAICLGSFWMVVITICLCVVMSFSTGDPYTPKIFASIIPGSVIGCLVLYVKNLWKSVPLAILIGICISGIDYSPIVLSTEENTHFKRILVIGISTLVLHFSLSKTLKNIPTGVLMRHEFEQCIVRFLTGFGYVFFSTIVLIPFYVMLLTSLKNQSELLLNPLNFSIDFSKGILLFRSYSELFSEFNFGSYLFTSFSVSILTVLITLVFAIPGAYSVARLKFSGRSVFARSILLIYMVPMIVLALPIYIGFSILGLRNSIFGMVLIYPVTTIPVALYMLQGYFRSLPTEIEDAGLMDGLSRLKVLWKITLPLSRPAIASVSLYIFMIAWNEFLLAFMLLDDPSKFTLTRGIAMLDSSEIPRQHLMAGSVIATVPIMMIFLSLERYMTKGLTAGSVKG